MVDFAAHLTWNKRHKKNKNGSKLYLIDDVIKRVSRLGCFLGQTFNLLNKITQFGSLGKIVGDVLCDLIDGIRHLLHRLHYVLYRLDRVFKLVCTYKTILFLSINKFATKCLIWNHHRFLKIYRSNMDHTVTILFL